MPKILRLLSEDGGMAANLRLSSGWSEVGWFLAHHVLLDNCTPAEILVSSPDRVLNAVDQLVNYRDGVGF